MLRRLLDTLRRRPAPPVAGAPRSGDYAGDRETKRAGRLSAEDRAWEAASLQRNRDNQNNRTRDDAAGPPRA